jgi:hypothetical protein
MKNGGPAQTPCETFARGEVEDYTVNILPARIGFSDMNVNESEFELSVYPNPAINLLNVDLKNFAGKVTMQVFDVKGTLMQAITTEVPDQSQLNIHSLPQGLYLLRVMDEGGRTRTTKWIKE